MTTHPVIVRRLVAPQPTFFVRRIAAFTLIELLTVIAIIGILAGIILVSIGGVRKAAYKARSISNLRQIHQGLALYDHENGSLPRLTYYVGGVDNEPIWNHLVLPCMSVISTPEHPSDPWRTRQVMPDFFYDPAEPNSNKRRGDYGVIYSNTDGPVKKSITVKSYAISRLANPSRTPLVGTAQSFLNGENTGSFYINNVAAAGSTGGEFSGRHGGKGIIAFADGHILTIERNQFYTEYMPWTND
ncbi:type II secretion system protein [Geminisphaera colitermitum]|uniref:type II secretion system protein n=1 Tax=Geminisphaera colitermitum TaxID=1148786 RepID=UPI000158C654|nr:prepilin-type N-terminal cleavage/methylation domain-containing protein [Geminisphaera colitermitum]